MTKVIKVIKTYESMFGTRSDIKLRLINQRGERRYQVVRSTFAWVFDTLVEAEKCFADQLEYDYDRYREQARLALHKG